LLTPENVGRKTMDGGLKTKSSLGRGHFIDILAVVVCVFCTAAFGQPWDGNGVEGDPYQIWTAADMQAIGADANYWDAHFKLMADIDLSAYTGTSFNIIGDYNNPFIGVFDGNGHTISNFTYASTGTDHIGLFGYVATEDAEIKDLGLIDPNIGAETNGGYIGSLVGYLDSASLTNCYVRDGSVCGGRDVRIGNGLHYACVGGLVGAGQFGTINKCYASSLIAGNAGFVGGLVGAYDGTISNCFGTSIVSGNGFATGGLAGISSGTISNSYASGTVDGNEWTGGLIGEGFFCEVSNCYATGDVNGNDFSGGLTGLQWFGSYTKCFWDSDINPDINGIGNRNDPNVTSKSTSEMQDANTFIDGGWDFVTPIWIMCDEPDYPRLWWECPPSVEAEVKIRPKTLNLGSKGKRIMCLIRLAEDYNVADIDVNSIFLEDEIGAEWIWFNEDQQVVMAKFSRSALQEILSEVETPSQVELVVSGELSDGTIFEGTNTIRVIDKGKRRNTLPGRAGLSRIRPHQRSSAKAFWRGTTTLPR
jgi:hypothetical protein